MALADNPHQKIISQALAMGAIAPQKGSTTLLVWNDRAHFEKWMSLSRENLEDLRMPTFPSRFIVSPQLITLPPGLDIDKVAILGVAFGTAADYSDTRLMYYQIIGFPQ